MDQVLVNGKLFDAISMTVPAGTSQKRSIQGDYIRVLEANVDVTLRIDGQGGGVAPKGIGIGTRRPFSEIEITAPAGSAATVTLAYAFGRVDDNRSTNAGSVAGAVQTLADDSIAAGATEEVVPANSGRRSVLISNLSASVTMRVGDTNAGAARGLALEPGAIIGLDTTAAIYVHNPGGSPESVGILEVVT